MTDLLAHLQALESELHHPGVRCSRERLEALLHPDFHEVGRSGRPYTRETVIAHLADSATQPDVVASAYSLQMLAPEVALLSYQSAEREPAGSLVLGARRSSVWLQTPVGWQMVYHQGTPSPTE
ncbi:DUF4440 domain-containing protein [Piscinibacter sakaiensis]|uniref:nuclear transport factor 2 family protein n=1 Tax=Piscinibacter sakaiensis TaxID=1547922 RepID=UPI003AAB9ED5